MSGWEWARFRTAARVRDAGARLVLGGMCWPSMPLSWGPRPVRRWVAREHSIWRAQAAALPGQVARLTGAPVAHASHVGAVTGETPLVPGVPWETRDARASRRSATATAPCSRGSRSRTARATSRAEVELGPPRPLAEIEDRFWIPRLTLASRLAWHTMNAHGNARLQRAPRARRRSLAGAARGRSAGRDPRRRRGPAPRRDELLGPRCQPVRRRAAGCAAEGAPSGRARLRRRVASSRRARCTLPRCTVQ